MAIRTLAGIGPSRLLPIADTINVKAYGAKFDGVTDDHDAVQAALDAVPSSGGAVLLPPGTGLIGAPLWVRNKTTLAGHGQFNTILKLKAAANTYMIEPYGGGSTVATQGCFRDFTIDGNQANNPTATDGIVGAFDSWTFRDLWIKQYKRDGIHIEMPSGGPLYTNRLYNVWCTDGGRDGLHIKNHNEAWIDHSWFSTNGRNGIHLESASGMMMAQVLLEANEEPNLYMAWCGTIKFVECSSGGSCHQHGIYVTGSAVNHLYQGSFIGDIGIDAGTWYGIFFDIAASELSEVIIQGNIFGTPTDASGAVSWIKETLGATSTAARFIIQSNTFSPTGISGAAVDAPHAMVRNNAGWATETHGRAFIPMNGAATTVDRAHGLAATPTAVTISPQEAAGVSAIVPFANIGATNFRITIPGAVAKNAIAVSAAVAMDGTTPTTETTAANNGTANDMTLLPAIPVLNDAYYIGATDVFGGSDITIGTSGVNPGTITWEYYNGAAWSALAGVTDGTTGFTAAPGTVAVTWTIPTDWAPVAVNSLTKYWVRARVSTGPVLQVETAVVVGTITTTGNATITVTAAGMSNSPKAVVVALVSGDVDTVIAGKFRTALGLDADVAAWFTVGGTGANVALTTKTPAADDGTMNIAYADTTSDGLTDDASSDNTTAGIAVTQPLGTQAWTHDALHFMWRAEL